MKKKIIQKMNRALYWKKVGIAPPRESDQSFRIPLRGTSSHHIISILRYFMNTLSNSSLTKSQISLAARLSSSDTYTAS